MQKASGTLKEIAQALNLSSGTVSRVLNGRGDLAQETRARVIELAAELNYSPRRKAQPQATPGLGRVALCIGNPCLGEDGALDPTFFGFHLLTRLQQVAGEKGVGLMVAFVDAMPTEVRISHLPMLQPGESQGIILAYPFPEHAVRQLTSIAPIVSIEHVYPGISLDVVGPTHALDAMCAVEHLYRLGHRRIAYVGDEDSRGHKLTQGLRHAGFVSGLARCGLPYRPADVVNVFADPVQKAELPRAIAELVRSGVTGILSSIDRHAYLLWEELPKLGLRVPQDVSLVGIGGIHRAAGLPQLTTWRCNYESIATGALDALKVRRDEPGPADLYREIQSVFVPGESSAPARA